MTPNDYLIKVLSNYFEELLLCTKLNEVGIDKHRANITLIEQKSNEILMILKENNTNRINGLLSLDKLIKGYPLINLKALMSENKKIVSFVNSMDLKNKSCLLTREELEDKVKDSESFMSFINEQHIEFGLYWDSLDDLIENMSDSEQYEEEDINSYDDIKNLILKAFDENDIFVLEQGDEGSAVFFKFQEIDE